jgi:alpha-ribazole phosphatase
MEIYLVRHTTPAVEAGTCYGQTDLDTTETFEAEAKIIQQVLPTDIEHVFSSPLKRCSNLARFLFPNKDIQLHNDLMEINCGPWEMRKWDDIPRAETEPWMSDFVNYRIPNGESYVEVFERTTKVFDEVVALQKPAVIVAHGGVLRSMLSHITNTALIDSFNVFKLHYGCVVKVTTHSKPFAYEMLSNIPHEKEMHRPKSETMR